MNSPPATPKRSDDPDDEARYDANGDLSPSGQRRRTNGLGTMGEQQYACNDHQQNRKDTVKRL